MRVCSVLLITVTTSACGLLSVSSAIAADERAGVDGARESGTASSAPSTRTYTFLSRPFTLGAFQTKFPTVSVPSPGVTGYLNFMTARLVDDRGRPVAIRRVMLHHVVFLNRGRSGGPPKRSTCPGRNREPFWGTGEEKQPLLLPRGYGYRVDARERWWMETMLMSHSLQTQRVRVEYRVRVATGTQLLRVKPLWLRASGCAGPMPEYDVDGDGPPGFVHRKEYLWKMPLSGRIVAASAHLHGSAKNMTVEQPRCGDRTLIDHRPLFGLPDDPVYRVRPLLHEPGPVAIGHFLSQRGIPIRRGEFLRVAGSYEGARPHPRVMAITHLYVAVDNGASRTCDPLPSDAAIHWTRRDGRPEAPIVEIPLHALDSNGRAVEIDRPPGDEQSVSEDQSSIDVRDDAFLPANLSVALGTTITWRFVDRWIHNVSLASGPRSVGSTNLKSGATYSRRFEAAGTYKLFCYLHPLTMQQVVTVRQ